MYQFFHGGQPFADEGRGQEGLFQPAPQKPPAQGGDGLIEDPQKTSTLFLGAQCFRQFQIANGRQVQLQEPARQIVIHGPNVAQIRLLYPVEGGQQRTGGADHRGDGFQTQGGQTLPELLLHHSGGGIQGKEGVITPVYTAVQAAFQGFGQQRHIVGLAAQQQFGGGEAGQLVDGLFHGMGAGETGGIEGTGGNVAEAQAEDAIPAVGTGKIVVAPLVQHGAFGDGAGGDNAGDIPFDQTLGCGRVFHLLTDGHLVALGDQTGNIALAGVVGDTAHGNPVGIVLGLGAVAAGEGQVQLPGSGAGIFVEHLIEVAETEKENAVRMIVFDLPVLLHHGGKLLLGHVAASFIGRIGRPPNGRGCLEYSGKWRENPPYCG